MTSWPPRDCDSHRARYLTRRNRVGVLGSPRRSWSAPTVVVVRLGWLSAIAHCPDAFDSRSCFARRHYIPTAHCQEWAIRGRVGRRRKGGVGKRSRSIFNTTSTSSACLISTIWIVISGCQCGPPYTLPFVGKVLRHAPPPSFTELSCLVSSTVQLSLYLVDPWGGTTNPPLSTSPQLSVN